MGLNGIQSNTLRALDAGRVPGVPEASKTDATSEPQTDSVRANSESAPRGVPQTLAVRQQLPPNTRLRVDEESKQVVAQILDENNEVVRQIPPEALLELSSKFNRLEGLLFDRDS